MSATELSDAEITRQLCANCGSLACEHGVSDSRCIIFGDQRHPQRVSSVSPWTFKPWGAPNPASGEWITAVRRARAALMGAPIGPVTAKKSVCRCDIRDLLSDTGHASACPERKVR